MGLLALDVTRVGLVMSSDSQDVVLTEGRCDPVGGQGHKSKDKILCASADHFSALIGYVGTEHIGTAEVRSWLDRFWKEHRAMGLADFCEALRVELSRAWGEHQLDSCMWVFVGAYEDGEPRFWYVANNAEGQAGMDEFGTYTGISSTFRAVNDLDDRHMPEYAAKGLSKAQTLAQISFHFRNGALMPGALIFDAFSRVIETLTQVRPAGWGPMPYDLERYAYVARQRMEFLKRLYSPTHGIYSKIAVPLIDGTVNVYALDPDGTFTVNPKIVQQSRKRP